MTMGKPIKPSTHLFNGLNLMNSRPMITEKIALTLAGCVFYGDPIGSHGAGSTENEIGRLCERFMRLSKEHREQLNSVTVEEGVAWEAHIQSEKSDEPNEYTVFVGIEVNEPPPIPLGFFYKALPGTRYTVFTLKAEEFTIGLDWIYSEWLPSSKYHESHTYMLWRYDMETFRGFEDSDSVIQAYIPVEENADG